MIRAIRCVLMIGFVCLFSISLSLIRLHAQEAGVDSDLAAGVLPRVVRFTGVLEDGAGGALRGVQGVTFALYAEQAGGAPLWLGHLSIILCLGSS